MQLFFTPWDRYFHLGWFPTPAVRTLRISGAPEYLHGMTALFFSDVHLRKNVSDDRLNALIRLIRAQNADIILMGGDYAETDDQCDRFFRAFSGTKARYGCWGVIGNNDRRDTLAAYMQAAGARELRNCGVSIDLPGGKLLIGGCDEYKYGRPDTADLFSGSGYRILLSHFPVLPECDADLQLSGHTHGGQMNFFGLTPYSLPFEKRYRLLAVRGERRIGGLQLALCSGIGVSRLPLRFGAAAEIMLLKFGK